MHRAEGYRILRLPDGAGLDEVKAAYRKLAFALHPDLNPNDPQAARSFQRLNEAYVLLKQLLEQEGSRRTSSAGAKGRDSARTGPPSKEEVLRDILKDPFARQVFEDIYREARQGPPSGPQFGQSNGAAGGQSSPGSAPGAGPGGFGFTASARQAASAYAAKAAAGGQGSQGGAASGGTGATGAAKGAAAAKGTPSSGKPSPQAPTAASPRKRARTMRVEWGDKKLHVDLSDGLWGAAKRWVRGWLDEEQTMLLPAVHLRPGVTVRLTVQQGVADTARAVDVVLPSDFVPGRPIRLKGLGRKFGPLKGDLYLRILAK